MAAVLKSKALQIKFPQMHEKIAESSRQFNNISSNQVSVGCVGCVDGMLVKIKTPSASETENIRAYFSGHYQAVGVNVQTCSDASCRFSYIGVVTPGAVFRCLFALSGARFCCPKLLPASTLQRIG